MPSQSASLAQLNAACAPLGVDAGKYVDISVRGTFSGTVSLQRSFDHGLTWGTLKAYAAAAEDQAYAAGDVLLQLAMTAYVSGAAVVRLGY
jgi:hypothetical protein